MSSYWFSYLIELEFKAKNVAKRERLTHVRFNQRQKEFVLIRPALVHLQDYVQHTVWVQVETSWKQNEQANSNTWIRNNIYCITLTKSASDTSNKRKKIAAGAASVHHRFTYERFDALQNQVAGDVAWQILAELGDQLGVALVLLS